MANPVIMRKLLLFCLVVISAFKTSYAQRTVDIGVSTGIVNYIGDLGNEKKFPFRFT